MNDSLVSGVLEMNRAEYGRRGKYDHVDAGINHLLVGIESDIYMIVRDFYTPLFLQRLADPFDPVGKNVSESDHLDAVSSIQQIAQGTVSASAAADEADFQLPAVSRLVVKHGHIIITGGAQRYEFHFSRPAGRKK